MKVERGATSEEPGEFDFLAACVSGSGKRAALVANSGAAGARRTARMDQSSFTTVFPTMFQVGVDRGLAVGARSHRSGVIITFRAVSLTRRGVIITLWAVIITIRASLSPFGRHYHPRDLIITEGVGEMITTPERAWRRFNFSGMRAASDA